MPNQTHKKASRKRDYTFKSAYDDYIELYGKFLSPHEFHNRLSLWNNHLAVLSDVEIRVFDFMSAQRFINSLLEKGLRPKSVKNIKSFLQVIIKLAIIKGSISKNPLQYIKLPSSHYRYKIPLSEEEQKRLIRAILSFEEPNYKDIFLFLLHGRRLGEVLNLKWKNVSLDRKIYTIPSEINKARKEMSYSMTAPLFRVLSSRYMRFYQLNDTAPISDSYVFINPHTNNRYVDVRRAWSRLLASANLPHVKIHSLRHIIGSYSINVLEIPIEKVSDTLGHSSISTTQIYLNHRAKNSYEVINRVLDSIHAR